MVNRLVKAKIPVIILCGAVIIGIQNIMAENIDRKSVEELDLYYVPNVKYLKLISAGFESFLADIYWIETVLYFGKKAEGDNLAMISRYLTDSNENTQEMAAWKLEANKRYAYFADMIITVTELDPYFLEPYLFGGLMISMKAGDADKSIEILEKGKTLFPDQWQIPYLLGYNYYFFKNDSTSAAKNFFLAAESPDCPRSVRDLAKGILLKTEKRRNAIAFLESLVNRTENQELLEEMKQLLDELKQPASREKKSGQSLPGNDKQPEKMRAFDTREVSPASHPGFPVGTKEAIKII